MQRTEQVEIDMTVRASWLAHPIRVKQTIPVVVPVANPLDLPAIRVPVDRSPRHRCEVEIAGIPRTVSPSVAEVLACVGGGATDVRMRKETAEKLAIQAPEVFRCLRRDPDRKVVDKAALYTVTKSHKLGGGGSATDAPPPVHDPIDKGQNHEGAESSTH